MASPRAKHMQPEERIIQTDVNGVSHVVGIGIGGSFAESNLVTASAVPGGTLFVADRQLDASIDRTES